MIARNYRTSKGTELPLLNLRGRQYLEVKYRLVWFREDHADWSIETDLISVTDVSAYAKATIRDESGRVIATSHKFESIQGFPDFIEKAETGAIGRALALIGYGTQFCADELDEGNRIVDAPVAPVSLRQVPAGGDVKANEAAPAAAATGTSEGGADEAPANAAAVAKPSFPAGEFTINFGRKYKGKKLKEISRHELEGYIQWLENSAIREGTPLSYQVRSLKAAFERLNGGGQDETEANDSQH